MKDGSAHMAYKAEHAVDMESGAVVAVTLQAADLGDTTTVKETLAEAAISVAKLVEREAELQPEEEPKVNVEGIEELVADKGYHRSAVLEQIKEKEVRTYIPEKRQAALEGQEKRAAGGLSESSTGAWRLWQEPAQAARRVS